jgi:hypothetical protein
MAHHEEFLQKLARCAAECEMCMDACLDEEDVKSMVQCIRLDRDCAKICYLTAGFVASHSPHTAHIISECEELCRKCGDECSRHDNDHCRRCAQACYECAEACKSFAEQMTVSH